MLLTSANVPANFHSQVIKLTSIDPDEGFCNRFSCPIPDFSDKSIVTRLNERTIAVAAVFPVLAKGQLHIVVQVKKSSKCIYWSHSSSITLVSRLAFCQL